MPTFDTETVFAADVDAITKKRFDEYLEDFVDLLDACAHEYLKTEGILKEELKLNKYCTKCGKCR